MSRPITCVLCGREVDNSETVILPNGLACDKCYEWLEQMIEETEDDDDEYLMFEVDE